MSLFLIIINALAILNLLTLVVILLLKKPYTKTNRILAIIVVYPIIGVLYNLACYLELVTQFSIILYVNYIANLCWAPLFYYYIHKILHKKLVFSIKSVLHIVPTLLSIAFFIWFGFQPNAYKQEFLLMAQTETYPWQLTALDLILMCQYFIYLPVCYLIIRKHKKKAEHIFSDTSGVYANWLQELVFIYTFLGAIAFFPIIIDAPLKDFLIYMPAASMIAYVYWVYRSISKPIIFLTEHERLFENKQFDNLLTEQKNFEISTTESDELVKMLHNALQNQKVYLTDDLNLQMLAYYCNTTVHALSAFINRQYGKNFFDLINSYRIEEAKNLLSDPDKRKFTIDAIAQLSGFSSRSAFYSAFKKYTGTTPGKYVKCAQTAAA